MLEQDYISKIKDEKIKKPMLKISNFFEPYIGNDHDDESKIILRASNPNFKGDIVINKEDILHMFIVKGKIKRNQL